MVVVRNNPSLLHMTDSNGEKGIGISYHLCRSHRSPGQAGGVQTLVQRRDHEAW